MRTALLALAFGLSACAAASGASDQTPAFVAATPAPAAAAAYPIAVDLPAGAYRLDPRHANVSFRIRHLGLARFVARFDTEEATLEFDPADPARSRLTASVDANSVNTGVLNDAGERAFDRQVARVLGAERTQQISFVSTAVERTGEHTARVTGDLTMNGQTHPAVFDVTFAGAAVDPLRGGAMVMGFSAYGVIDRTQWGVTGWSAFAGPDVQIVIDAEFVRA